MLGSLRVALAAICLIAPVVAALAEDMTVDGAWVRPSLGQTGSSALYFTIANSGPAADSLSSVEVPEAEEVQIHSTTISDGVAGMRSLTDVPLAPGAKVVFEPKSNHVMLLGLKRPLHLGDHLPAILHFKTHAPLAVDAVVSMSVPQ